MARSRKMNDEGVEDAVLKEEPKPHKPKGRAQKIAQPVYDEDVTDEDANDFEPDVEDDAYATDRDADIDIEDEMAASTDDDVDIAPDDTDGQADEGAASVEEGTKTSGPEVPAGEKDERDGDAHGKERQEKHNRDVGKRGEDAAVLFLMNHGFEILDRNWRCRFGEADIVASDEGELVFVEVKTRLGVEQGLPEDAVTPQKRCRYEKIAAQYLKEHDFVDCYLRFDVISIMVTNDDPGCGKALLRYHRSAFSHD